MGASSLLRRVQRYNGKRLQSAIAKGFSTLTSGLICDFAFQVLDRDSGIASDVDWESTCNRPRRELRHIPGPFRLWLKRKLANAPRPLLFDASWRKFIQKKEHRGFESPGSSQAFALNIFGPLAQNSNLAKEVLKRLLPGVVTGR